MKKMAVLLTALLASPTSQAAQISVINGVEVIDIREWAKENSLAYAMSNGGIKISGGKNKLVLFPYAKTATLNGSDFTLLIPANVEGNRTWIALADARKVFGYNLPPLKASQAPAQGQPQPTPAQVQGRSETVPAAATPEFEVRTNNMGKPLSQRFDLLVDFEYRIAGFELSPFNIAKACRAMVLNSVKSPTMTNFIGETRVSVYTDQAWGVAGELDSPNSYGALLRGYYYCTMWTAGDTLKIVVDVNSRR